MTDTTQETLAKEIINIVRKHADWDGYGTDPTQEVVALLSSQRTDLLNEIEELLKEMDSYDISEGEVERYVGNEVNNGDFISKPDLLSYIRGLKEK